MASYSVNTHAVAHVRGLIEARQYVLDSDWGEVQPRAADGNRFLKTHSWDEYLRVRSFRLRCAAIGTDQVLVRAG